MIPQRKRQSPPGVSLEHGFCGCCWCWCCCWRYCCCCCVGPAPDCCLYRVCWVARFDKAVVSLCRKLLLRGSAGPSARLPDSLGARTLLQLSFSFRCVLARGTGRRPGAGSGWTCAGGVGSANRTREAGAVGTHRTELVVRVCAADDRSLVFTVHAVAVRVQQDRLVPAVVRASVSQLQFGFNAFVVPAVRFAPCCSAT